MTSVSSMSRMTATTPFKIMSIWSKRGVEKWCFETFFCQGFLPGWFLNGVVAWWPATIFPASVNPLSRVIPGRTQRPRPLSVSKSPGWPPSTDEPIDSTSEEHKVSSGRSSLWHPTFFFIFNHSLCQSSHSGSLWQLTQLNTINFSSYNRQQII